MNQPAEDYLEKALSAAFAVAEGGRAPGAVTRPGKAPGPIEVPPRVGRYPVEGLVGRGGIGLVLRARDEEIGRAVAVKILHDHLADDAEMVRRFVEEARVGGGLEHPGVVPVHEMGRTDDGRPFFTMKLVEGETLSQRLAARTGPTENRLGFLSQFERICQIVAYAHARGVVHLDLKPSNVLIGAFGEVLVTDWGFARRDDSAASPSQGPRIAGTPAYMSPEQARGDLDKLGPRSDVFALGAILCEILTGAPPYEADSASEILLAASRSWLEPAWKRLDSCGADPALIALARRCLAPEQGDRPETAGAVGLEVDRYLRSLEERARALAIEAAEARTRADAERRQRKLVLALMAVVLGALVVAGGLWLWFEHERAARARDDDRHAAGMAERVRMLAEHARTSHEPEPALWDEAVATARQAARFAHERGLTQDVRDRLDRLEQATAGEQTAAFENERFLKDLSATHERLGDYRDAKQKQRDYAAVFARAGIDVGSIDLDEAVRKITASPIRSAFVSALDEWAHSSEGSNPGTDQHFLVAILNQVDPNPWRMRVRAASNARDVRALEELAAHRDRKAEPAESQVLLAMSLRRLGRHEAAMALLEDVQLAHPGDYDVHHELGMMRRDGPNANITEAIRQFSMALALRPRSAHAMVDLGQAMLQGFRVDEAEQRLEAALKLDPHYAPAIHYLGVIRFQRRDYAGAEELLRKTIATDPGFVFGYAILGLMLREAGRPADAATVLAEAVRIEPNFVEGWGDLANALLEQGKLEEARAAYAKCHEVGKARGAALASQTTVYLTDIDRLIEADAQLRELGSSLPTDASPREAWAMARVAWYTGRHLTAARIYDMLLAKRGTEPVDPSFMLSAAQAAVSAGSGGGSEKVADAERPAWRDRARSWMQATLESLDAISDDVEPALFKRLVDAWLRDKTLDAVREPAPLTALPPEEASAWTALWKRMRGFSGLKSGD